MIIRILISAFIGLFLVLPLIVVSMFVVPILLLTSWSGYNTFFGNHKWGRATTHPITPTTGFWSQFNWLVLRNPINNFMTGVLSIDDGTEPAINGRTDIGDKKRGGFYSALSLYGWEYYWVKPYNFFGKRCVRVRIGWKLINSDKPAAYVFTILPFKKYLGV